MNDHGAALAVGFFVAFAFYFGFRLWRRDRSIHPGSQPLLSITCGISAGLSFVSPPFARLEVWPGELVIKNCDLTVPRSDIIGLELSRGLGGTSLLIHHRRAEVSPVQVCGIDAARLHSRIAALYPEVLQSTATPPVQSPPA